MANNVYLIMSGLSPINDKINLISDRIEEIEEKQKTLEQEDALSALALDKLSSKIADTTGKDDDGKAQIDLNSIFNKF